MEAKETKFNITETVRRIGNAISQTQKAVSVERELSAPILTDYGHIQMIFDLFRQSAGIGENINTSHRKMFVFIIQYLYAPRNLFGEYMPDGLRLEIVRVLNVKAKSVISRCAALTLSEYRIYTKFRMEVNRIFEDIVNGLIERGVLVKEDFVQP